VRKRSTIARREYVALTAVSERSVAADLADLLRKGQLESTGSGAEWLPTVSARVAVKIVQ